MPNIEFEGKWNVYAAHLITPFRPLVPDAKKSVPKGGAHGKKPSTDGNLIIPVTTFMPYVPCCLTTAGEWTVFTLIHRIILATKAGVITTT